MNIAGADLNLLLIFHSMMTERNVTRAAAKTGLSQPALSNALRRLRDLFQDKLFVKGGKAMVPTPRALEISPDVDAAIASIRKIFQQPEFEPYTAQRAFRLATTDDVERLVFPTLVRDLSILAPSITITCRRLSGIYTLPRAELQSGALDFALGCFSYPPPPESGVLLHSLFKTPIVCLVRKNHPLVKQRLSLRQYCELEHVTTFYPGEGPGLVDRVLAEKGQARTVKLSLPHWSTLPFVVANSDLIATVPETVARTVDPSLRLRRLRCPLSLSPFSVGLVWHARTHENASHQWFRDLVIRHTKELSKRFR